MEFPLAKRNLPLQSEKSNMLDSLLVRTVSKLTRTNYWQFTDFRADKFIGTTFIHGVVNQLMGHSKKLIQAALPLRPLLKTKRGFQLVEEHQSAMD